MLGGTVLLMAEESAILLIVKSGLGETKKKLRSFALAAKLANSGLKIRLGHLNPHVG
jgi:hypothetical protein